MKHEDNLSKDELKSYIQNHLNFYRNNQRWNLQKKCVNKNLGKIRSETQFFLTFFKTC